MNKLNQALAKIKPFDKKLYEQAQSRLDNLTKPIGSLGKLEQLAKQVVAITGNQNPQLKKKVIFTLAGDHGITEEKISAYPKEVTPQMVYNFLRGGAGINVISKYVNAKVVIVDMGVACDLELVGYDLANFRDKKVAYGTKNFRKEPAMTKEQAVKSLETGIELVEEQLAAGVDLICIGEMGIGNTTSASAITSVATGSPVEKITGRGTGLDGSGLKHKIDIINESIKLHNPVKTDALDILSKIGGFEIAGMAGIIIAAVANRIPIVLDGFISGASALAAVLLNKEIKDYLIAGHCSVEPGHKIILDYLSLNPVLNFDMRLGEGTGAALSIPIIETSVKILQEMATFDSAGVSRKS